VKGPRTPFFVASPLAGNIIWQRSRTTLLAPVQLRVTNNSHIYLDSMWPSADIDQFNLGRRAITKFDEVSRERRLAKLGPPLHQVSPFLKTAYAVVLIRREFGLRGARLKPLQVAAAETNGAQ
jgi:hypothetical protein